MGGMRSWSAVLTRDEDQEPPQITRDVLLRIWSYAQPYWWPVLGSLILILISTAIGLVSPQLFRLMIDDAIPRTRLLTWQ